MISVAVFTKFRIGTIALAAGLALSAAACGAVAAGAVHANPSNTVFVVPPMDLPPLAREAGEAMLLHEAVDGRVFLYIEQNRGTQLASFDVTDPVHIKSRGSIQLDAAGTYDFVAPLGTRAELVRFRQGHQEAVLSLPRIKAPQLRTLKDLTVPYPITDSEGFVIKTTDALPDSPHETIDPLLTFHLNLTFDVKEVRAHLTRADTGTTFVLTDNGLYVIRRPTVEWIHQMTVTPPN
jgi:hypothetical protein